MPPRLHRDPTPADLSFAQQRLWFLARLAPDLTAYTLPYVFELRGVVDVGGLAAGLAEVTRRHEVLRSRFAEVDGVPVQVVDDPGGLSLQVLDVAEFADPVAAAERVAAQEAATPFDLARGPLLRCRLLRLGPQRCRLLLTVHHIVFDGWSMGVLLRELAVAYEALAAGSQPELPDLELQYGDYAAWQRRWLSGERLERDLRYWRERLAGAPPLLELPLDRPRPAAASGRGAHCAARLPGPVLAGLRAIAAAEGATLFMVLLAAFQLLLGRLSGQSDVVVGSPVAGRTRPELEPLIGFFVNTLPLRCDLSGDPSFLELLSRARESTLDALAHQEVPFERLVEELQPERTLSHMPLVQVIFNLANYPRALAAPSGLLFTVEEAADPALTLDLSVTAEEDERGLEITFRYARDLFDDERARMMLGSFKQLLAQVAFAPGQRIGSYDLATPEMKSLVRVGMPIGTRVTERNLCVRILEWADREPDRIAIEDSTATWTYGQLGRDSETVARELVQRGIVNGDFVAIRAPRCGQLAAVMVGVLRAGAAFAILDPAYPMPRLQGFVDRVRPRFVLDLVADAEPLSGVQCLAAGEIRGSAKGSELPVPVDPDLPAYAAPTSGTTGAPAAVIGTHRPLWHFFEWYASTFSIGPGDRGVALSGLSHDPLHREVLGPLWVGATVILPDTETFRDPLLLRRWLADKQVSVMHITPPHARTLVAADGPALRALRHVFFRSDTVTLRDVSQWRQVAPNATITNFYGTQETPQAIAFNIADPALTSGAGSDELESARLPVGRGIDGVELLLVNAAGALPAVGELAEIYVRTPYLTVGYARDPERTANRFLPNPITGDPDDLSYRTGDLGRYRWDGVVEFVGRADTQVKVRGFRVELGEVESVLSEHPKVAQAAAEIERGDDGAARLAGYVVAVPDAEPTLEELREWVASRLPEFMVPASFVRLERLPLTPNGKLDRRALAASAAARLEPAGYAQPRTGLERQLADIWLEVLGVDRVGIHDNFFALGGHSLLAVRIVSRLRAATGVHIPVRMVFDSPTVADLALQVVAMRLQASASEQQVRVRPSGI